MYCSPTIALVFADADTFTMVYAVVPVLPSNLVDSFQRLSALLGIDYYLHGPIVQKLGSPCPAPLAYAGG